MFIELCYNYLYYFSRFVYVPSLHTKDVLAEVLVNCFLEWNIDRKLSTIIVDNCSTNDVIDGDQDTVSKDLVQIPIGSVTRARAKKFKDVLNGLIQELWAQANSWRPIEHDPRGQQKNRHLDSSSRRIRSRLRIGMKYFGCM